MFRHLGNTRTLSHNLKIASLLSFVAGIVSVVGFFSIQQLTTNVTGHFTFFVDEVFKLHFWNGFVYFLYIFFFFFGSFVSNFLIELLLRKSKRLIYEVPASLECLILFSIGFFGQELIMKNPNTIACGLLFAMGLQNSLVTTITSASVRTTHLTGLFTDLGIELSQLIFYKEKEQKTKLISSIKLRFTIITFFFIGGVAGGFLFSNFKLYALVFAGATLALGLIFNHLKINMILLRRKFKNN